jgi:hypothetical protein
MTESPDWKALIQKHLDGQTSEEEASTLSARIVTDADIRSEYLKAAKVHGALADEMLAVDLGPIPFPAPEAEKNRITRPFAWLQQIAAALVAGAFIALVGVGVAWTVGAPKSEARILNVVNGDFEVFSGPVDIGFPTRIGQWSGNPAEVVKEADGNRIIRFLETGNVKGDPNGGASNCALFQLIDLSSLRQQWDSDTSEAQISLELSARFRRDPAATDAELPKLRGSCRIFLFKAEPESIGEAWPQVLREAVALGKKSIWLEPGEKSAPVSASCILESEANLALISVAASGGGQSKTPIELGGYFVDDVQLTVIKQPILPVRFVK